LRDWNRTLFFCVKCNGDVSLFDFYEYYIL